MTVPKIPPDTGRLDGGLLAIRVTAYPEESLPTPAKLAPKIANHWLMRATVG